MNLSDYGDRVRLINMALAGKDGEVKISGEATGATVSDTGISVPCVSIPTLFQTFNIKHVDIFKMDIEGSELSVIKEGAAGWMSKIKLLLLETHGSSIENQIIPILKNFGFSIRRHRNVWYCRNKHFAL